MFWEGFARSILSDLWAGAAILFIIAILYGLASFFAGKNNDSLEDQKQAMSLVRIIAALVVVITFVILFGRAASVAFANRIPRQDIDRTPVYEQMDSHGQRNDR